MLTFASFVITYNIQIIYIRKSSRQGFKIRQRLFIKSLIDEFVFSNVYLIPFNLPQCFKFSNFLFFFI